MVFDISLKTTSEDFQFFFFDWAPIVDVAGRSGRIMKFAASYAGICQGICCVQHPVAGRPAGARFFPPFSTPPASRQGIRHRRLATTLLLLHYCVVVDSSWWWRRKEPAFIRQERQTFFKITKHRGNFCENPLERSYNLLSSFQWNWNSRRESQR